MSLIQSRTTLSLPTAWSEQCVWEGGALFVVEDYSPYPLYRSLDGGESFTSQPLDNPPIWGKGFSAAGGRLFLLDYDGQFRTSSDLGETWEDCVFPEYESDLTPWFDQWWETQGVQYANGVWMLAGGEVRPEAGYPYGREYPAVLRSTDGVHWNTVILPATLGDPDSTYYAPGVTPTTGSTWLAVQTDSNWSDPNVVFRSGDNGLSWEEWSVLPASETRYDYVQALVAQGDVVLAMRTEGDLCRSTDGGLTWTRIPTDRRYAVLRRAGSVFAMVSSMYSADVVSFSLNGLDWEDDVPEITLGSISGSGNTWLVVGEQVLLYTLGGDTPPPDPPDVAPITGVLPSYLYREMDWRRVGFAHRPGVLPDS